MSIAISDVAHSGKKGLEVRFRPGKGWANAYLEAATTGDRWAAIGVDEIRLWIKGDGSDKEIRIGLQAWSDGLVSPIHFGVPVSLKISQWREVIIPLSQLQESVPTHPLRLRGLISFQVDGVGELGPARFWLDDITVRNAHGQGARFASGPLDQEIAKLAPVRFLPRLGNWGNPGFDSATTAQLKALNLRFFSTAESSFREQQAFLRGFTINYCPGRPEGNELAGLGLAGEDIDQDAHGHRMGEGVQSAVFHPAVLDRFCEYTADRVRLRKNAPWVASFTLSSPISMYGEVHYSPSTAGQYAVFSRPAQENFRRWLRERYQDDLGGARSSLGAESQGVERRAPA